MSEEAREQGFFAQTKEFANDVFPPAVEKLTAALSDPAQRTVLTGEMANYARAVQQNSDLCRFHFNVQRSEDSAERLQRTEHMTALYAAADGFEPVRAAFITQDEIDEMLRSGSGIERGKKRISEFYAENHTQKERIEFLKNEYGWGGRAYGDNQAPLPQVEIVDMQEERTAGNDGMFSETLAQALRENLDAGNQSLLLLNRRGYHTIISCASCNQPVYCPNCSIPMTYHKVNDSLMCHYCGHTQEMVTHCPSCGGEHLRKMGFGTQRLEEELKAIVPDARVLRMDADTTMSRYAYEERFNEFRSGKYDIMLGTQMIGKGLDFPNVTLVGVLSVDKALYAGDFRSYERTFSLVTQVVGRGGRGDKTGRAILQTSMPDHYVLRLAAQQAYPEFYAQEIALRRQLIFPPICDICVIGFTGMREQEVRTAAMHTADVLKAQIRKTGFSYPIWVLEPVPCIYGRVNGKFRYQLVIKCKNTQPYRSLIRAVLTEAGADRCFARVHLYADMNGDVGV